MSIIPYTCTNKAKLLFYVMIVALCLLRLTIIIQIKAYDLEGYQVYLLPTLLYYGILLVVITALFFGYKFFYTIYDEENIVYHNALFKKTRSMEFDQIKYARFGRRGVQLYSVCAPDKKAKPDLFIPFFRLGIIEAIAANDFFENLIDRKGIVIEKTFKVLPGYSKPWNLISALYALLTICMLIISMEPLYTIIVLYQSFS